MAGLMDILSWVGSSLDKPGAAVRGLLGARPDQLANLIPFSDTLGITNPEDRVSGASLLGMDPDSTEGMLGGMGVDIFTNPFTYMGGFLGGKLGLRAAKNPAVKGFVGDESGALNLTELQKRFLSQQSPAEMRAAGLAAQRELPVATGLPASNVRAGSLSLTPEEVAANSRRMEGIRNPIDVPVRPPMTDEQLVASLHRGDLAEQLSHAAEVQQKSHLAQVAGIRGTNQDFGDIMFGLDPNGGIEGAINRLGKAAQDERFRFREMFRGGNSDKVIKGLADESLTHWSMLADQLAEADALSTPLLHGLGKGLAMERVVPGAVNQATRGLGLDAVQRQVKERVAHLVNAALGDQHLGIGTGTDLAEALKNATKSDPLIKSLGLKDFRSQDALRRMFELNI